MMALVRGSRWARVHRLAPIELDVQFCRRVDDPDHVGERDELDLLSAVFPRDSPETLEHRLWLELGVVEDGLHKEGRGESDLDPVAVPVGPRVGGVVVAERGRAQPGAVLLPHPPVALVDGKSLLRRALLEELVPVEEQLLELGPRRRVAWPDREVVGAPRRQVYGRRDAGGGGAAELDRIEGSPLVARTDRRRSAACRQAGGCAEPSPRRPLLWSRRRSRGGCRCRRHERDALLGKVGVAPSWAHRSGALRAVWCRDSSRWRARRAEPAARVGCRHRPLSRRRLKRCRVGRGVGMALGGERREGASSSEDAGGQSAEPASLVGLQPPSPACRSPAFPSRRGVLSAPGVLAAGARGSGAPACGPVASSIRRGTPCGRTARGASSSRRFGRPTPRPWRRGLRCRRWRWRPLRLGFGGGCCRAPRRRRRVRQPRTPSRLVAAAGGRMGGPSRRRAVAGCPNTRGTPRPPPCWTRRSGASR
mmetsp:Transcript_23083/g.76567  ORF Transcript_23083/g.76567 Transcript_23083/m.76567 type:complete len:478 (+) Transcript_23083:286-1719(+)